jgi:uncharacterized membrane protein
VEIEKQRDKMEDVERWAALAGGAAAVYVGLRRRSMLGAGFALAGAPFVLQGITGHRRPLEYLGWWPPAGSLPYGSGVKIRRSITIDRTREDLYHFVRNFENLARFMAHVQAVKTIDERHSHWVLGSPGGITFEWDTEIIADEPEEIIGWRSVTGAVAHAGSIRFERAAGGRGAVVRVQLQYNPPGGRLGAAFLKLLGDDPDRQAGEDLRRLKQLMEIGEIPTTEGQPSGRRREIRERVFVAGAREEWARLPEPVEEASVESFPASDAPSWTTGEEWEGTR